MNKPYAYTYTEELEAEKRFESFKHKAKIAAFVLLILTGIFWMKGCERPAMASELIAGYSVDQWANAIYIAEGGNKTNHPYGILARYKTTTARQACINTFRHYWKDYSALPSKTRKSKRFLDYASNRYCPIGSNTDNGTCKNWPINVGYWLERV